MHKLNPGTEEQARALLKKLGLLKAQRIIEGAEREQVMTMLRLTPSEYSNNQHLWTETWRIGNVVYKHITGDGVDELLEVIDDE
jgi:hypothetical protein